VTQNLASFYLPKKKGIYPIDAVHLQWMIVRKI